ncbi:subtilase family protein [Micromonospora pisi]|uniref:Subtilase family protein n=1 Tax=Micromonospora pisi TaxID=589240 RepID=A0A495JCK9_9ACTN|nr:S8 family serine peptidase [Micromonospora pisi]RKR86746.1 subtilase family protein [Micromonospora pisi]
MTAKVRAWSSVLGCLALLAVLTQTTRSDQAQGAEASPWLVQVATTPSASTPPSASAAPSTSATSGGSAAVPRPTPATAASDEYVKYYPVTTADQGAPKSLTEIAGRLLGTTGRAKEIYHLNVGRTQPDGQALTDSMQLRAGWLLVLPWDAVGEGVRYGLLPTEAPGPETAPSSPPAAAPQGTVPSVASSASPQRPTNAPSAPPSPTATQASGSSANAQPPAVPPAPPTPARPPAAPPASAQPPAVPPASAQPPAVPPAPPASAQPPAVPAAPPASAPAAPPANSTPGKDVKPAPNEQCAVSTPTGTNSGWAHERMAADQAWGRTQGEGVLVAVIDSGVDASLPELSGRVAVGADIPTGSGRGNTDCLGSGTAMASIVAASPAGTAAAPGNQMVGLAPAATILPLRVVHNAPKSEPVDAATAIQVAVSAGAKVVALGAYVDLTNPAVRDAIESALDHDVVVVASAPTVEADVSPQPGLPGLLRVGGVGAEGQPAANYRTAEVDVTAPGIDVASLGVSGSGARASSGSQYAVAFVAGAVTLVRSAFPNLDAAQVVHRIKATADRAGHDDPDPVTGWGMINPNAAVTMVLAEEAKAVGTDGGGGPGPIRVLTIAMVVVIGLAAVAVLARRSSAAAAAAGAAPDVRAVGRAGVPPGAGTPGGDDAAPGAGGLGRAEAVTEPVAPGAGTGLGEPLAVPEPGASGEVDDRGEPRPGRDAAGPRQHPTP